MWCGELVDDLRSVRYLPRRGQHVDAHGSRHAVGHGLQRLLAPLHQHLALPDPQLVARAVGQRAARNGDGRGGACIGDVLVRTIETDAWRPAVGSERDCEPAGIGRHGDGVVQLEAVDRVAVLRPRREIAVTHQRIIGTEHHVTEPSARRCARHVRCASHDGQADGLASADGMEAERLFQRGRVLYVRGVIRHARIADVIVERRGWVCDVAAARNDAYRVTRMRAEPSVTAHDLDVRLAACKVACGYSDISRVFGHDEALPIHPDADDVPHEDAAERLVGLEPLERNPRLVHSVVLRRKRDGDDLALRDGDEAAGHLVVRRLRGDGAVRVEVSCDRRRWVVQVASLHRLDSNGRARRRRAVLHRLAVDGDFNGGQWSTVIGSNYFSRTRFD